MRGGLVAPICLVNGTKGLGGPLWLLTDWSVSLKCEKTLVTAHCLVDGTKGRGALLTKVRGGLL